MTTNTTLAPGTPTGRRWRLIAAVLVVAVISVTAAVLVTRDDGPAKTDITFEVTGPDTALSIVWQGPEMKGSTEVRAPALPWSMTVETSARQGPVSVQLISRMTDASLAGPFTCRILVDGRLVEQDGPYAVPRCWTTMQRILAGVTP